MTDAPFVPDAFDVPQSVRTADFVLEPLGPKHNDADYAAWMSSLDHIRATPGFAGRRWPREMTLEANRGDLESHAADFAARTGFTYTVLDAAGGTVIGCVYIYPPRDLDDPADASVRSWVRAANADLDEPLWRAVSDWLGRDWPFSRVDYAPRA